MSISNTCSTADSPTGWRPDVVVDRSGRYPAARR